MRNSQFKLLIAVMICLGIIGVASSADLLSLKHEGKTGLKDMVKVLNDNVQAKTYYGTQGNLLCTSSTNVFSPAFSAAPMVIVTVAGQVQTNMTITTTASSSVITWGATNVSFQMMATGLVNP